MQPRYLWHANTSFSRDIPSLVAQRLKRLPGMRETRVQSLSWEDPLEKEMATHSSTLAWRIPWREEPGRLQSMESQRVRHDWATSLSLSFQNSKTMLIQFSILNVFYPAVYVVSIHHQVWLSKGFPSTLPPSALTVSTFLLNFLSVRFSIAQQSHKTIPARWKNLTTSLSAFILYSTISS